MLVKEAQVVNEHICQHLHRLNNICITCYNFINTSRINKGVKCWWNESWHNSLYGDIMCVIESQITFKLLNILFMLPTMKSSPLLSLWYENPFMTGGFPSQRAGNSESISISWRHHISLFPWQQLKKALGRDVEETNGVKECRAILEQIKELVKGFRDEVTTSSSDQHTELKALTEKLENARRDWERERKDLEDQNTKVWGELLKRDFVVFHFRDGNNIPILCNCSC